MSFEICQFCGTELRFRRIRGTVVPLHPTGSQCVGKQLYRAEERDICHRTTCPRCGSKVFFIRHNGGCAWFDDLGRPWDKHGCFADTSRLPAGWEVHLKRGWTLCYLWCLGDLVDETGGVFVLSSDKPDWRRSPRYLPQVKLQREDYTPDTVYMLHGKTALLNKERSLIATPGPTIWRMTEHMPSYRKPTHQIDDSLLRPVS